MITYQTICDGCHRTEDGWASPENNLNEWANVSVGSGLASQFNFCPDCWAKMFEVINRQPAPDEVQRLKNRIADLERYIEGSNLSAALAAAGHEMSTESGVNAAIPPAEPKEPNTDQPDFIYDVVREDGRLERMCKHGIGHTVGHRNAAMLKEDWIWVHGCDGCCSNYNKMRS